MNGPRTPGLKGSQVSTGLKRVSRRIVLRGAGSLAVGLPLLESLGGGSRRARAGGEVPDTFAIFFRQANGVACENESAEIGFEPERFWPRNYGPLTEENVEGRALGELSAHLSRLLVVHNVRMFEYNFADGHARGALQALTARGPLVEGVSGDSEGSGVSIDHLIGEELNEDGRESMFMYTGQNRDWLGGACISYRGPGDRRAPLHNPLNAYALMMGVDGMQFQELILRQRSINDLVREQMGTLLGSPVLSAADRERLEVHRAAIRDLEESLACNFSEDEQRAIDGVSSGYDSDDGDAVLAATRAHMDIAALAVTCGYTRSVAIQVGNGNDGSTRYRNLDNGQLMENFHFVSHRRQSHDAEGDIIPNSDALHAQVDIQFARTFAHLLDRLTEYVAPNGQPILDAGIAVWYNDNGNGPGHSPINTPVIIGGSANGFLKQGEYVRATGAEDFGESNHNRVLNTLGSAVGLRNAEGDFLDDFGDPALPRGILSELMA